jgi:hypothetical protein
MPTVGPQFWAITMLDIATSTSKNNVMAKAIERVVRVMVLKAMLLKSLLGANIMVWSCLRWMSSSVGGNMVLEPFYR